MNTPSNARDIARALKARMDRYPKLVASALYIMGLELQRNIVQGPIPRRDGVLARSVYTTKPEKGGDGYRVEVGVSTVYARFQHYNHPTRSLYVQKPYEAMKRNFEATMAKAVRQAEKLRGAA